MRMRNFLSEANDLFVEFVKAKKAEYAYIEPGEGPQFRLDMIEEYVQEKGAMFYERNSDGDLIPVDHDDKGADKKVRDILNKKSVE